MLTLADPSPELKKHDHALFSPDWLEDYYEGEPGCEHGRGSYTWRPYGFGSNVNSEYVCGHFGSCWSYSF